MQIGVIVLVITTTGLWWNRNVGPWTSPTTPLAIRRVTPTETVLRGKPNEAVQVELELTNTTRLPIELVSPSVSCSCQIATSPDKVIAAGGSTQMTLSLRYPPSRTNTVPIVFKAPHGHELGRTEIVLEADVQLPYFMQFPDTIEIPVIDGVSEDRWITSAMAFEETSKLNYVTGIRMTEGGELIKASLDTSEKGARGAGDCQRTYQLTFELLPPALTTTADAASLHGIAIVDLNDGTHRPISWKVTRKAPLAIQFDAKSGYVKGIRRVGAKGTVTLRMVPEGSGKLTPERFENSEAIVAQWEPGAVKPESIEAHYHGAKSVIPLSVSIP